MSLLPDELETPVLPELAVQHVADDVALETAARTAAEGFGFALEAMKAFYRPGLLELRGARVYVGRSAAHR